jgi:hypothetical protein
MDDSEVEDLLVEGRGLGGIPYIEDGVVHASDRHLSGLLDAPIDGDPSCLDPDSVAE